MDELIREIIQTKMDDTELEDEQNLFAEGFDPDLHWQIVQEIEQSLGITMDDEQCDEAVSILDFITIAKESPSDIIH